MARVRQNVRQVVTPQITSYRLPKKNIMTKTIYPDNDGDHILSTIPALHRIFVNRNLSLENIKFCGYDLDYTLADYKFPEYEELSFQLIKQRLVEIGYPEDLLNIKYNPGYLVRGLWFDKEYGTLLKVDPFGHILLGAYSNKFLTHSEISQLYPGRFIPYTDKRVYILNTNFNLPEGYLLAATVYALLQMNKAKRELKGIKIGKIFVSYRSIFEDIRRSVDWVHMQGSLKSETVKHLQKYVVKDKRLPMLLEYIKRNGRQNFLLTNSGYDYTNKIMTYLFDFPHGPSENDPHRNWTTYFDHIIVDAAKPSFFSSGTVLREINPKTGNRMFGDFVGPLKKGVVYSGGNSSILVKMLKSKGRDILYVGDHVQGDIVESKQTTGWRTFLVVPELTHELLCWFKTYPLFKRLQQIDMDISMTFRKTTVASLAQQEKEFDIITRKIEETYGKVGSMFRSGAWPTHFSSLVFRYSDIYSGSPLNLLHYPFTFTFRPHTLLLAHEQDSENYWISKHYEEKP